jgi:hypothetical protein
MKIHFLTFFLLLLADSLPAQVNIKTARIRPAGVDFAYPMCKIGEVLELQFDVLDDRYDNLVYSIRHCNADFEPDDLSFSEFAEGFDFRQIDSYENSFNTHQNFTHYTLQIPNNDIKLLISGNYVVNVYDGNDMEKPVLTKRFMIYEDFDNSKISAEVSRPFISEYSFDNQQVSVSVKTSVPTKYLKVYAMKNYDFQTRKELKISGFKPGEVIYAQNDKSALFQGGSEFQFADLKDVHFKALGIDEINYERGLYAYKLTPFKPVDVSYSFQEDLNGRYYIKNDKGFSLDLEADYVKVLFRVKYDRFSDCVFIIGEAFEPPEEMFFNSETQFWEKEVLLKQGLYNYDFASKNTTAGELKSLSGSWYNTENDYLITVYTTLLKDPGDRLVMYRVVNTIR